MSPRGLVTVGDFGSRQETGRANDAAAPFQIVESRCPTRCRVWHTIEGLEPRIFLSAALFRPSQSYAVGMTPLSVAVADVNRDDKPDLIVANYNSGNVGVLFANGNGTCAQETFNSGTFPRGRGC